MTLTRLLHDVGCFHRLIGAPVAAEPTLLSGGGAACRRLSKSLRHVAALCQASVQRGNDLSARVGMAVEELAEWVEAHEQGDLAAAADAWGDRLYVLLGDAVAAGLPADEIFAEVQRSNLTKAEADASGKGRKGAGFRKPELAALVRRHAASPGEPAAS